MADEANANAVNPGSLIAALEIQRNAALNEGANLRALLIDSRATHENIIKEMQEEIDGLRQMVASHETAVDGG